MRENQPYAIVADNDALFGEMLGIGKGAGEPPPAAAAPPPPLPPAGSRTQPFLYSGWCPALLQLTILKTASGLTWFPDGRHEALALLFLSESVVLHDSGLIGLLFGFSSLGGRHVS